MLRKKYIHKTINSESNAIITKKQIQNKNIASEAENKQIDKHEIIKDNSISIESAGQLDDDLLFRVIFKKAAYKDLIDHARTSLDAEICGVLVGKVKVSKGTESLRVHAIIPGAEAEEKRIQVTFTQETWNNIHETLENDYPNYQIVGWYHTHPGFGVEFSDMDTFIHQYFFPSPNQIAFVTDPLSRDVAICINTDKGITNLDRFWVANLEIRCFKPNYKADSKDVDARLQQVLSKLEELQKKAPELSLHVSKKEEDTFDSKNRDNFIIPELNDNDHRIFPPISPEFYNNTSANSNLTPDQIAAKKILCLSEQDFSFKQRYGGKNLDALGQIGHLLYYHKMALNAEFQGQWERADFFWREIYSKLENILKSNVVWQALADRVTESAEVKYLNQPEELRQRFFKEIIFDSHCAIYNSRIQNFDKLILKDRAFVHHAYIQQLLSIRSFLKEHEASILRPPYKARLLLLEKKKKWKPAIRLCTQFLRRCPDEVEFQNKLAELNFTHILNKIKNTKETKGKLADARTLAKGINQLTSIRKHHPKNTHIYLRLGRLHHLRAKILKNAGGSLEDALIEAQKAFIFYDMFLESESKITADNEINDVANATLSEVSYTDSETEENSVTADKVTEHAQNRQVPPFTGKASHKLHFPFLFWVFSNQNRLTKALAVIAIVLFAITTVLGIQDCSARKTRNTAYQHVLNANRQQDYLRVLEQAENFFSNTPLNTNDIREPEIKQLYQKAFVRWFMTQDDQLSDEALEQVKRYEKFTNDSKKR